MDTNLNVICPGCGFSFSIPIANNLYVTTGDSTRRRLLNYYCCPRCGVKIYIRYNLDYEIIGIDITDREYIINEIGKIEDKIGEIKKNRDRSYDNMKGGINIFSTFGLVMALVLLGGVIWFEGFGISVIIIFGIISSVIIFGKIFLETEFFQKRWGNGKFINILDAEISKFEEQQNTLKKTLTNSFLPNEYTEGVGNKMYRYGKELFSV